MKKCITLLAMIVGCLSIGCNKSSTAPPTAPSYFMHATINGVAFNGTNCIFYQDPGYKFVILRGGYFLGTTLSSVAHPYISMDFNYLKDTGRYAIVTYHPNCTAGYDTDSISTSAVSGIVIITSISDKLITGTFNLTMEDGITITDGSFSAKAAQ